MIQNVKQLIDGNYKLLDSVITKEILEYATKNYLESYTIYITDWQLENNTQEVELDNDLEFKFYLERMFLCIDM